LFSFINLKSPESGDSLFDLLLIDENLAPIEETVFAVETGEQIFSI